MHSWQKRAMGCATLPETDGVETINEAVRYCRNNAGLMHYRRFVDEGMPIGNGAAESSHRHVLQTRMKHAGQR